MNYLFYLIKTCSLRNWADDNTLDMISFTIETVLKTDTEHVINWFIEHFMQINLSNFQFMCLQKYSSKEIKLEFIEEQRTLIPCI